MHTSRGLWSAIIAGASRIRIVAAILATTLCAPLALGATSATAAAEAPNAQSPSPSGIHPGDDGTETQLAPIVWKCYTFEGKIYCLKEYQV